MRKLRIFIADDHVVLREGLSMLIDAQPDMEVVGQAADGRALAQQIPDCQADIVIMDIAMPGGGAQATAQLRQACPNVQVVALTDKTMRTPLAPIGATFVLMLGGWLWASFPLLSLPSSGVGWNTSLRDGAVAAVLVLAGLTLRLRPHTTAAAVVAADPELTGLPGLRTALDALGDEEREQYLEKG